jgi:transcriptional regulator with XRE-family HTH domain
MLQEQTFGRWLKLKRKSLDLTRDQLAERVGCSAATIRKLESEERKPSAQIAERLGEIFQIPAEESQAFLRFARGDWKAAPDVEAAVFPWQTPSPPTNLPNPVTRLIGRIQHVAAICGYLASDEMRLVTLTGLGGIGKTRLGIDATRAALPDFPDGVFFVSLASLKKGDFIAPAIKHVLGFVDSGDLSAVDQIKQGIDRKQMLIVLDNCEHLIENAWSLNC